MSIAKSKVTAQGRTSIPADVRKKLGVGPGSTLEWHDVDGNVMVRREGTFTSLKVHQALFPQEIKSDSNWDVKAGIRKYIRRRHARG